MTLRSLSSGRMCTIALSAPLKCAVRRYCNEGHDILSAADVHGALEARPVKGSTAAVCEVDRSDREIKVNRTSNFSIFHKLGCECGKPLILGLESLCCGHY